LQGNGLQQQLAGGGEVFLRISRTETDACEIYKGRRLLGIEDQRSLKLMGGFLRLSEPQQNGSVIISRLGRAGSSRHRGLKVMLRLRQGTGPVSYDAKECVGLHIVRFEPQHLVEE
jgi:hypothetical protein